MSSQLKTNKNQKYFIKLKIEHKIFWLVSFMGTDQYLSFVLFDRLNNYEHPLMNYWIILITIKMYLNIFSKKKKKMDLNINKLHAIHRKVVRKGAGKEAKARFFFNYKCVSLGNWWLIVNAWKLLHTYAWKGNEGFINCLEKLR